MQCAVVCADARTYLIAPADVIYHVLMHLLVAGDELKANQVNSLSHQVDRCRNQRAAVHVVAIGHHVVLAGRHVRHAHVPQVVYHEIGQQEPGKASTRTNATNHDQVALLY